MRDVGVSLCELGCVPEAILYVFVLPLPCYWLAAKLLQCPKPDLLTYLLRRSGVRRRPRLTYLLSYYGFRAPRRTSACFYIYPRSHPVLTDSDSDLGLYSNVDEP